MRYLLLPLVLLACDPEVADISTVVPDDRPDVAGSYQVTLSQETGCESEAEDLAWAVGALEITGEPDMLLLEFESAEVLEGEVDSAFALDALGTVQPGARELDAIFQGVVVLGDDGWDIDGDLVADVIESTDESIVCTLSARLEAQQIP